METDEGRAKKVTREKWKGENVREERRMRRDGEWLKKTETDDDGDVKNEMKEEPWCSWKVTRLTHTQIFPYY